MNTQQINEFSALWDKINEISKQLSDFSELLNEQRKADIDYIAMEADIELEQENDNGTFS